MTDFKLAGIVSAVGLGLGYLLGGRSSKVMEAEEKPKLTPKQLEYLNMMKSNYDGYAYVEVDNRGLKPYKTGPVQQLLSKKIISIPKDRNKNFYGGVENYNAYNVVINPIALKYAYKNPFGGFPSEDKFAEYMAKQQPSSQNSSSPSVQGEYGITYMESHNDAKNQHRYYLLLTSGKDNYTAYGRLPGYGREATMKLDKQSSASKMKELAMKKMKTYQLVGHKYDQIPSEIRAKLETKIGVKPSSPIEESKPQKEEPKKPMNARLAMAMKRRQMMEAEGLNFSTNCLNCGNQYQVMDKKDHVKLVCYDCSDYIKLPKSHLSDSNKRELIMIQEGFKENEKNEAFHKKYPHGFDAETFEASQVTKPFYIAEHEDAYTFVMHPSHCGHYKMMDANNSKWFFWGDYDSIEGMVTEFLGSLANTQADGMPDDILDEYKNIKTVGDARKWLWNHYGFKINFGPCFRKLPDWDSKAYNGLPIKPDLSYVVFDAESVSLKKSSCCCGATKKHPCLCMIKGTKQCSPKSPMCPCYKEIAMGTKVEMEHTKSKEKAEKIAKEHLAEHPDYYSRLKKAGLNAETFEAKGGKRMYCPNCKTNRTWNKGFKKQDLDYSKGERPSDFAFYVCQKCNYALDPKTGKEIVGDWRKMFGYDAETFEAPFMPFNKSGRPCPSCRSWSQSFIGGVCSRCANKDRKNAETEASCFRCGCKGDYEGGNEINLVYCELCDDYWCNDACREPSCWDRHYNYTCTRNAAENFETESSDSIPKPNPVDKEETFAWVKREHPHIKTEADKEMDEYNYAALTYHPEELESGAVNALKAGDLEAAQNFVKALNRQSFIKEFQAERNMEEFPLLYSTHNVNTAYCISHGTHYNYGLCEKMSRYGNYRGSEGYAGVGKPTCTHCLRKWKSMTENERKKFRDEFANY
jgi:predicted DNA-binding WGR domain protein